MKYTNTYIYTKNNTKDTYMHKRHETQQKQTKIQQEYTSNTESNTRIHNNIPKYETCTPNIQKT